MNSRSRKVRRKIRPVRLLGVIFFFCMVIFAFSAVLRIAMGVIDSLLYRPTPEPAVSEEPVYVDPVYTHDYSFDTYEVIDQYLRYRSDTYTSQTGLDLSSHQGDINWQKVKDTGIDFVIIRVGYRGYETGLINEDQRFREYIQAAENYGFNVGVYFFSQAVNTEEAVEEAEYVLSMIKDYRISMPIAYDMEQASDHDRIEDLTKEERTQAALAFAKIIKEAGYTPIVYGSSSWLENEIAMEDIQDTCGFWVASYTKKKLPMSHQYEIWQYSNKGRVPGISVDVDLNIYMKKN